LQLSNVIQTFCLTYLSLALLLVVLLMTKLLSPVGENTIAPATAASRHAMRINLVTVEKYTVPKGNIIPGLPCRQRTQSIRILVRTSPQSNYNYMQTGPTTTGL